MKVALIGSAPSSVRQAPFQDKSWAEFQQGKQQAYPPTPFIQDEWELWGCSPGAFGVLPRFTRFFEVHRWEPGQTWFSPEYCQFLRDFQGAVYTGRAVPEIKNHIVYPTEAVEKEFSSYFLTSSLSLMCALAIMEIEEIRKLRKAVDLSDEMRNTFAGELGKTDADDVIGFWGVDMAASEEYGYQRAGCQFFILEALRRGIGIYIPPESDLIRPMPVYGICEWDHNYIKMTARMREINARRQEAQNVLNAKTAELHTLSGVQDDLAYVVNTWSSKFGMEAGVVLRQTPGTGLGGGISHVDGKPVDAVALAMAQPLTAPVETFGGIETPNAAVVDGVVMFNKGNGAAHPE